MGQDESESGGEVHVAAGDQFLRGQSIPRGLLGISVKGLSDGSAPLEKSSALREMGLPGQTYGLHGCLPGLLQPALVSVHQRLVMLKVAVRRIRSHVRTGVIHRAPVPLQERGEVKQRKVVRYGELSLSSTLHGGLRFIRP